MKNLNFIQSKVENGPLTSKLQRLKEGDNILFRNKPVGTLVNDALLKGKRLFLFSTGTGIALSLALFAILRHMKNLMK